LWDHVIVGGGSAGCVLASRLSEDAGRRVLLIEAGPPDADEDIHVPTGYLRLGPRYDWGYESEPEPDCKDRRIRLPRGRVLGGCSSVNAMIYIRGNPRDYDEWGLPGWSWDELMPYFIKAESNVRGASAWHGAAGPMAVSDARAPNAASLAFVQAAVEAGLRRNDDFNGAEQDGAGLFQVTQRDGARESTADAYLRPVLQRHNLRVVPDTLVQRVLFDGRQALGVLTTGSEGEQTHMAAEVLLCAGAYNSPQLLMLSGIGCERHLSRHGINLVLDRREVGENLSDHAATEVLWTIPEPEDRSARRRWRAAQLLLATQTGAFTSGLAEAGGFARVEHGAVAPDTQLHAAAVQFLDREHTQAEVFGAWVSPCLLTPQSRGCVRLASADPTAAPVISNAFYTASDDLERMLHGLRLALAICSQPALAGYCVNPVKVPGDESDEALREHIAGTTFAFYHPVGTCRMGEDESAVVDPELRVRGLAGLRVVDASVMPTVPRGNINAATVAIAERAADLIRADSRRA